MKLLNILNWISVALMWFFLLILLVISLFGGHVTFSSGGWLKTGVYFELGTKK
ncbi:hypothetical protein QT327_10685 [Olivibacter sp. 47]|uniref:hypothetical protein n=1 Tax=Olivibacter sp. 47 TaxID=3056486 RepID=UPI0025A3790D|nr:hypothetical protein [Olivibacter sp. 47]MDM8174816.1 hypothetical protein [Olivibacter sp. 47]